MRLTEFAPPSHTRQQLNEVAFVPILLGMLTAGLTLTDLFNYKKRYKAAGGGQVGWDAIKGDVMKDAAFIAAGGAAGNLIHKGWKSYKRMKDIRKAAKNRKSGVEPTLPNPGAGIDQQGRIIPVLRSKTDVKKTTEPTLPVPKKDPIEKPTGSWGTDHKVVPDSTIIPAKTIPTYAQAEKLRKLGAKPTGPWGTPGNKSVK